MYKHIVAITNRHICKGDFLKQIEYLAHHNLGAIILREKDLSPKEYEELAKQVIAICKHYNTPLVLHSFIDVAIRLHHANIHLPFTTYIEEREKCDCFKMIGISAHNLEEIQQAEALGATYATYSPIFPTTCKPGMQAKGLMQLQTICSNTALPIYALGGINQTNEKACMEVGAKKVCMMSVLMQPQRDFDKLTMD